MDTHAVKLDSDKTERAFMDCSDTLVNSSQKLMAIAIFQGLKLIALALCAIASSIRSK
jgi:hypothetical protein